MKIGSLFSGYGGLDMAVAAHFNAELAWYSEIEPAACTVLAAHHPDIPNIGDITTVDWAIVTPVDILTGGYPCQPFSHAGKRQGKNDVRHLWPYVRDAISHLAPRLVVLENVAGHLTLGLADVLSDLAEVGYDARWGVVRASDAGAPHQRKRVFIVAYPNRDGHGAWQDGAGMGGVEAGAAGEARQRERSRGVAGTGGVDDAADTDLRRREQRDETVRLVSVADTSGYDASTYANNTGRLQHGGSVAVQPQHTSAERGGRHVADAAGTECREPQPADLEATCGTATESGERTGVAWGKYEPAIRRWESITRPAPAPTIPGKNGRPRLNPAFVEWMMGLPAGHVTGHGLRPAQELKMLGNGVVPQQALLALSMLAVAA